MWQAISNLLSEWHTEAAESNCETKLPGGEIHAAWHLRFGGKDYFVKCDERELLPIFTAEADQLELLSRSKNRSRTAGICRRQRSRLQLYGDGVFAPSPARRA
nr:protein kinase-like protein [Raoultella sp. NCTC 9187]